MRVFGEDGEEIGAVEGVLHLEESEVYRLFGAERGWMDGRALPAHPEGGLVLRTPAVVGRGALSDGVAEVAIQIRAKASKLPEGLYLRMLEELEGALPGLSIGAQAERSGSAGQGAATPLAVEALMPVLPLLEAALERLAARPAQAGSEQQSDVPLSALRRVGAPELRARAERPDRERIIVWREEDRADARWLGLVAERVRQVVARLERAAAWLRGRGGPVAVVRAGRLREGAARLQAGRRPFAGMERGPGLPGGMPEAPVASVLRLCRFFLSPLFDVRDGPNPAMVRLSWQIYEMWCLFTLRRRLAALLPGWAWEERGLERLMQEPEAPAGEVPDGAQDAGIGFTARGPGATLWIDFNPVFTGYLDMQAAEARRFTLSQPRRPDLAIGVQDGRGGRWICLDAKWRAGQWRLGEALSAAHVYRDALRDRASGGAPLASLLLAPSCTEEVAPWFDSSFIEEHGVGILEYRPDRESGEAWLLARMGVKAG